MEWTAGLPSVRTRVVPFASSTPRSDERQVYEGPLLTSVPGGMPSSNHRRTPLQAQPCGPLSPLDEASTLAHGVRVRRTGRLRVRSPLKTVLRAEEGGLTPRPSPSENPPPLLMGLSEAGDGTAVRLVRTVVAVSRDLRPRTRDTLHGRTAGSITTIPFIGSGGCGRTRPR